jgi:riboflavin synthase
MFTGLIEAVGELVAKTPLGSAGPGARGGMRVSIASPLAPELALGDSLAVNGVCLTVTRIHGGEVDADVGPETLRVTTLGALVPGAMVNLERPLRPEGRMGGHFVQGHVDAVGHVERLMPADDFHWLTVTFPGDLAPYIVPKGSIAIDGISLTVATLRERTVDVMVVPYTMEHTNLRRTKAGDAVNLECDMVGKYVVHALKLQREADAGVR